VVVVLGTIARVTGFSIFKFIRYIREELLIVLGTSSSESALPRKWKGDLALNGQYVIELFSFPFPPARPSRPEACGLRHLAFSVEN
ncbi:hypothetical protein ONK20_24930, partial [Salmonella enterica subsp. enterica serovar Montevideo]|nr:hypothetical protein [Salmonella enterica subsp. enterica serovar Montevideo]